MVEGVVVAVVEAVAEVVRFVWPVTGWVVLVVPSVVAAWLAGVAPVAAAAAAAVEAVAVAVAVEALAWLMDEIKTR